MKTYLSIFFFFWVSVMQAQDWQHLCFPGKTLYADSAGHIEVTETDSLRSYTVGDTVFYSFRTIKGHTGVPCADTTGGSLMGSKIHKLTNGWVHFFNYKHDTVYLNTMASRNSSWRFCKINATDYFQATVTALGTGLVLGLDDSVKTITLQAKDNLGQNISHPLNNTEIVLSKHLGLIKLINLNDFPDDATAYALVGKSQEPAGLQEITGAEIFDFDIGDQFHYLTQQSEVHYVMESKEINTVTDKQILSPVHVRYSMHSCTFKVKWLPWSDPDSSFLSNDYVLDINLDSVNQLNQFAAVPEKFIPYAGFTGRTTADGYSWTMTSPFNQRGSKAYSYNLFVQSSGCWEYSLSCDYCYTRGLGLTRMAWSYGTDVYSYKDLVYYKKGSETYGTPVARDCSTLISDSEMHEARVTVSPNPFSSSATVEFRPLQPVGDIKIRITDMNGRKVMEDDFLPPSYQIKRGAFTKGIYFLQIVEKEGKPLATSKMIIN